MRDAWWSTLGLSLDIVGALLVGAEAVTLERVRRWHERAYRARRRILHARRPLPSARGSWRPSIAANLVLWFVLITAAYPVEELTFRAAFDTTPEAVARHMIGGSGEPARLLRTAVLIVVGGTGLSIAVLAIAAVLASLAAALGRGLLWIADRTPAAPSGSSA